MWCADRRERQGDARKRPDALDPVPLTPFQPAAACVLAAQAHCMDTRTMQLTLRRMSTLDAAQISEAAVLQEAQAAN